MKSAKRVDAIIFDMDGVITDSEPLQVEAEQWVCEVNGISVPEQEWITFKGKTNRDIFTYIVNTYTDGLPSVVALIEQKRKRYIEISRERLSLIPGSKEFILRAKTLAPKIALTTSSSRIVQRFVFDTFDLHKYFDVITTGAEVQNGKPHPEPYRLTLQKLGMTHENTYVIEDSDNGVLSAKAAGCTVIGITTSFPKEVLFEKGADRVVNSFAEIDDIFH